mmetsp:Transcript_45615/g.98806  ORF Transcript_45615/g.98806 Transcript_45615/m.98806 type:complete len:210 (+) Transcript_45615:182-811(+)
MATGCTRLQAGCGGGTRGSQRPRTQGRRRRRRRCCRRACNAQTGASSPPPHRPQNEGWWWRVLVWRRTRRCSPSARLGQRCRSRQPPRVSPGPPSCLCSGTLHQPSLARRRNRQRVCLNRRSVQLPTSRGRGHLHRGSPCTRRGTATRQPDPLSRGRRHRAAPPSPLGPAPASCERAPFDHPAPSLDWKRRECALHVACVAVMVKAYPA